jgi:tetratricopeptide (TPR) repeat protein
MHAAVEIQKVWLLLRNQGWRMYLTQYRYKAFITYSHKDKKWGDWLHRALETYRVPYGLVGKETQYGPIPKRLFPVFRDREELPSSSKLGEIIAQALWNSSHLIVICSPRAAKSLWVNEEIRYFKSLGRADRILCLIVDGEPNASDIPGLEQRECFPPAAMYELGEDGNLSATRCEPIAADTRFAKDEKRDALLKLIAGMIGVGFDDLKRRDQARKHKRLGFLSSFSLFLVAVMIGLVFWVDRRKTEAENAKNRAEALLTVSEYMNQYMLEMFCRFPPFQQNESEDYGKSKGVWMTEYKAFEESREFLKNLFLETEQNLGLDNISDQDLLKIDHPEHIANFLFSIGRIYLSFGDSEKGLEKLRQAENVYVHLAETKFFNLEEIMIQTTLEDLDHEVWLALQNNLRLGEVETFIAIAQEAMEQYEEAILTVESAVKRFNHGDHFRSEKEYFPAYCGITLGDAHQAIGEDAKAVHYLEQTSSICLNFLNGLNRRHARHPDFKHSLSRSDRHILDKEDLEIKNSLLAIIPIIIQKLGSIYEVNEQYDDAIRHYRDYEKYLIPLVFPEDKSLSWLYAKLGRAYALKGNKENAELYCAKALKIMKGAKALENSIGLHTGNEISTRLWALDVDFEIKQAQEQIDKIK